MFTGPEAVQFRNAVVTWLSECAVEAAPPDNDERDEVLLTSSPPAKKKSVLGKHLSFFAWLEVSFLLDYSTS